MVNQHRPAISVHEIGVANRAVGRSDHAGTVLAGDVHPPMKSSVTAEGIAALAKMSSKTAFDRPQSRRCSRSQPAAGTGLLHVTHANADVRRAIHGSRF